jgi:sugar/nucleoside kinase (ribokinase family)
MRVLSLGVHILDILGAPVTGPPGPNNRWVLDDVRLTAGGTAAGVSVDLAKLGVDVVAVGAIGDDDLGELVASRMAGYGIDVSGLVRKSIGTSVTILPVDEAGERTAVYHRPGASRHLSADDIDPTMLDRVDLLHVPGLLSAARERGVPVTMDLLSGADATTLARLEPVLDGVDYFFPNHLQVEGMTGLVDPAAGAERLRELGVGCVVVTRGADGVLAVGAEERIKMPALPVEAVDFTGCGDAFSAGFIVGTLKDWGLRERVRFGGACATLVAGGLGSDAGIVDFDSTVAFLDAQAVG